MKPLCSRRCAPAAARPPCRSGRRPRLCLPPRIGPCGAAGWRGAGATASVTPAPAGGRWAAHCSAGSALSLALIAPIPSPVGAETDGDLGTNRGPRAAPPGFWARDPPSVGSYGPRGASVPTPRAFPGADAGRVSGLSGPLRVTGWHRPCSWDCPSGTLLAQDQSAGTAFTRGLPRSRDPRREPGTRSSESPTPTCGTLEPAPCRAFNFYPIA